MTRMAEQRRTWVSLGLAAATAVLAVGTALAHGGYGPGHGMGCGPGYGPETCGAGAGPGMRQGMGPGYGHGPGRGVSLLTEEERTAHRAKMQSLASVDECKAYFAEFSQQLQAKAKEKGVAFGGPNAAMCDRMQAHGRFTK